MNETAKHQPILNDGGFRDSLRLQESGIWNWSCDSQLRKLNAVSDSKITMAHKTFCVSFRIIVRILFLSNTKYEL